MKFRSQILLCNLLVEEFKCIKLKATWEIDTGNALLGKLIECVVEGPIFRQRSKVEISAKR